MAGTTRKINGYKCQKCKAVSLTAEITGGICPKCGHTELQPACAAKGRKGRLCGKLPMDNGRCYFHGGASPAPGPTHPNYKHGRLSKVLPPSLSRLYEEAKADPDLLSISSDVALLDTLQVEAAARIDTGESAANWRLLKKTWGELERGMAMKSEAARVESDELRFAMMGEANELISSSMQAVGKLIGTGASRENQVEELVSITNNLVSVKSAENARQYRAERAMTVAEAQLFLYSIHQLVAREVKDRDVLFRIGKGFEHIMLHGTMPPELPQPPQLPAGLVVDSPIPQADSAQEVQADKSESS